MKFGGSLMDKELERLRVIFTKHQVAISTDVAEVFASMGRGKVTRASWYLHKVVDDLNALKSSVEGIYNLTIKKSIDDFALSAYDGKAKSAVGEVLRIIEDMKGNATEFMTELSKYETGSDMTRYANGLSVTKILELSNALSEYYYLHVNVLYELISIKKKREDRIEYLLEKAKYLGLNERWALSSLCLAVQEIAAKRKIRELGGQYEEDKKDDEGNKMSPFRQLEKTYELKGKRPPEILISVINSWRRTRAKLLHEGRSIDKETAQMMMDQTKLFLTKMREK